MRSKKAQNFYWSTYGAQLFCVQAFILTWIFPFPLIPLVGFVGWLLDIDSVHICLVQIWAHFFGSQVPRMVQIGVLIVNLWTVVSCTFLILSSLTRLLFYLCITAFWTRLGAREKSERLRNIF